MTKDYKDTLNLPITAFPMKANLAQREPEILQRWLALDLYRRLRENSRGKPRFILHDGPPYANARPHLGTALNKIIKDMVVKSKILGGYDAPYVPGWDCHGLPIELNVEKKIGKVSDKLSPKEFRGVLPRIRHRAGRHPVGRFPAFRGRRGLAASLFNHGFSL